MKCLVYCYHRVIGSASSVMSARCLAAFQPFPLHPRTILHPCDRVPRGLVALSGARGPWTKRLSVNVGFDVAR